MPVRRLLWLAGIAIGLAISGAWIAALVQGPLSKMIQARQPSIGGPSYVPPARRDNLDVPYVPTPEPVVQKMLEMARVGKDDIVYDLGCGDGRIVVTAAKQYGARGVGVDIDPQRIKESNANAQQAGVTDRVKFVQRDLFKMDFKPATVMTLYLLPEINLRLKPRLLRELKPGTRIVSHDFDMGEWKPEKTVRMHVDRRDHTVYFWTVPARKIPATANRAGAR